MFRAKRRILERTNYSDEVTRHVKYPFRLNMYDTPPQMQMPLEEFETWASDRIRVLSEAENFQLRSIPFKEIVQQLKPVLDKYIPLSSSINGTKSDKERKKDHFSHYILRLAFCRTPELRDKYVQLETLIFKVRYETDDSKDRKLFIDTLNLEWEQVTESEKMDILPQLRAASQDNSISSAYFKVDFEKVIELVDQRRVFLRNGKAYVPENLQQALIVAEFSSRLSKALEQTARLLPRLDEDDRLVPVLKHLSDELEAGGKVEYEANLLNGEKLNADMIDQLQKEGHFPLCMSTMHKSVQANHHAKFETRREYGSFLKAIGLSADESLKFWRKAFSRKTDDEFTKEYRYYFRHMYGLEGSRIQYKPMSCIDMCRSQRTSNEEPHGCPYRLNSIEKLTQQLKGIGITGEENLLQVKEYVEKRAYHRACTEVYELTHPNDEKHTEPIGAPSTYFARSFNAASKTQSQSQS